jgi:hypothetical protein
MCDVSINVKHGRYKGICCRFLFQYVKIKRRVFGR